MKKRTIITAALALLLSTVACNDDSSPVAPVSSDVLNMQTELIQTTINNFPSEDLSNDEINGLIFMREEEKLARDVYAYFYEKYGMKIFNNIVSSENTHMLAIKMLLDKYGLTDPVTNDGRGEFKNDELSELYQQLTNAGNVSLLEALKVGATIEDLDIRDLTEYEGEDDNQDIIYVYDNLTLGSRNHLRSFYYKVLENGGAYEAQFISQELLDSIVTTPKETGSW